MAADVDAGKLEAQRQDAQERLAESRAHVAELEGETAQLKTAWDDRRNEASNTASRDELIVPPPPPAPMQMPLPLERNRWRNAPRGDVNDTPAAPDATLSQQPPNNIAPPP